VNDKERFRVVITDGVTTCYAMLATQMNDAVNDGSIKAFTVISVEDFITSDMNGQS
jgi:Replication factor-A protein 1, N-terminal domain